MKRLFKETPIFTKKLELYDDTSLLKSIQDAILENPLIGNTIAGTGGIKKFRMPDLSRGKGKRGGLRVIYLDLPEKEITYLLYVYGKDEADDLTNDEKKAFKALVEKIKGEGK
jgi:hypothetical protein